VIKGWTEGLQLMKEGDKFEFFIHPRLGYGGRSTPKIPGNSCLIFEVELIEILES
jgi:peptidylprolyl isomerase